MSLFLRMAWRNIWRNPRRSLILTSSVAVGYAGLVFSLAFMEGMKEEMLGNAVDHTGHLQVHAKNYQREQVLKLGIDESEPVIEVIESASGLAGHSSRVKVTGLVSSAKSSSGAMVIGIDPEKEATVTTLHEKLVEGRMPERSEGRAIAISKRLSDKLHVGLRGRVVIMANALDGDIASQSCRVVGVFHTGSKEFDQSIVFVGLKDLSELLRMDGRLSEIAVRMDSREDVQDAMAYLSARLDTEALELLTWEDLMPVLISFMETSDAMTYGYFIFIFIAVAFGIVNTLLMAVFERTREFGMLQALGLRPKRVFGLIIVESAWLGVVGVLIGCAISILVIQGAFGGEMDLSSVSESLAVMGMSSRVPMPFTWDIVVGPGIAVLIMAALSAIIPARKAAKLHPAEAVAFV